MVRGWIHRVRIASVLLAAAIGGCSNGTGTATSVLATAGTSPATEAPIPARPPFILEDAGREAELAPGRYTSRVFAPVITIELGTGWFRRDAIGQVGFNLRTGPNGDRDVTFISGADFLQCEDGPLVTKPPAAAIVEAITASPKLTVASRREVSVADLTGTELRLVADPKAQRDDNDLDSWLPLGCVVSIGDAAFPTESWWIPVLADMNVQLIVVEVHGRPLMIRGSPSSIVDEHYDAVLDIVARMSLE